MGLVIACLFAGSPTFLSPLPSTKKATIDGVVLFPSLFGITTGSFPSITATQEFVVPKSIPIILLIIFIFNFLLVLLTRIMPKMIYDRMSYYCSINALILFFRTSTIPLLISTWLFLELIL